MRTEEKIGRLLRKRGETLSLAESCTGGLLAGRLTGVPGASAYFVEARVTYADAAKVRLLGVSKDLLKRKGAVSPECALAMARGVRWKAGTDWALAVTGIAGPDGGTRAKPVGLVHIALAGPEGAESWEFRFKGGRDRVRKASVSAALERLRRALLSRKK